MKKLVMLFSVALLTAAAANAQAVTTETKVKPKKSLKNRVHNTIHPKRKEYSGVKVKREIKKEGE